MAEKRDSLKKYVWKYFALSLFLLFILVGLAKQLLYGGGPLAVNGYGPTPSSSGAVK